MRINLTGVTVFLALCLLSVSTSSCGARDLPTPSPLPASVLPAIVPPLSFPPGHNLNWEGTTSDGLAVGFQISGNHVTGIYVELPEVQGDACVFGVGGVSIDGFDNFDLVWGRAGPPINDGAFTVVSIAPMSASSGANQMAGAVDFTLSGMVNASSGEGVGTFRFSTRNTSTSCVASRRVTWTIAKTGD